LRRGVREGSQIDKLTIISSGNPGRVLKNLKRLLKDRTIIASERQIFKAERGRSVDSR